MSPTTKEKAQLKLEQKILDIMNDKPKRETLKLSNFQYLVDKSKTDLDLLLRLKNLAVEFKDYELGSILRTVEKENFPLTDEEIIAKERVVQLELLFRMVDISFTNDSVYYVIDEVLKKFNELGGAFRISDATIIKDNRDKLFKR